MLKISSTADFTAAGGIAPPLLSGAISLLFGVVLFFDTTIAPATLIMMLGAFAVVSGALLLAFAFNVKGWRSVLGSPAVA